MKKVSLVLIMLIVLSSFTTSTIFAQSNSELEVFYEDEELIIYEDGNGNFYDEKYRIIEPVQIPQINLKEPRNSLKETSFEYNQENEEVIHNTEKIDFLVDYNGKLITALPGEIPVNDIVPFGNISNPENYGQHRNTVLLLITDKAGRLFVGTGFMISNSVVGTVGHNLYNSDFQGSNYWAKSIKVIPAAKNKFDGGYYGSANGNNFEIGGDWGNSFSTNDDWGIIKLDRSFSIGYLGLRTYDSSSAQNSMYSINGYPGGEYTLSYAWDAGVYGWAGRLAKLDAYLSGGNSGGPVYKYYSNTGYTTDGYICNNYGSQTLRITFDSWLLNKFGSYR